jgi:SHS2 domain-containing protein
MTKLDSHISRSTLGMMYVYIILCMLIQKIFNTPFIITFGARGCQKLMQAHGVHKTVEAVTYQKIEGHS